MMELLLHSGADPNAPSINDEEGHSTFLHALERCCSNEMFDLFLQRGADITKRWGSETALEIAVSSTTNELSAVKKVIEIFSQHVGGLDSTVMQQALACITVDKDIPPNADLVKALLDAGANVNAIDPHGETLLQKTLSEPDVDVVKLLLESGAEVNILATEDMGTPLQTAILYEEPEIANLLIDYGADINALPAKKHGATALQAAAIHGYLGLARRLLEHGADVTAAAAPIDGRTAIDAAAEHGRLDMLQLLLNSFPCKENLSLACDHAASFVVKEGHTRVVTLLRAYTSC
ncbi:ankyrin repeat-containing domain protein [Aspergillus caelatus]|uniref:Ankyrin repeat-containing domain protein n=1 Tax=Aspergillus caelatus TaxID=61420 RepID=A0A5N6ZPW0_9EURO|nr:ankyrin repeat-containing domain protein [Aspergillus caelatus]KAE8359654.1 ankyrin repeat-containing domain protein [Aspergillus caelatus]